MTTFITIQDGLRLTLQVCIMGRALYAWYLFTARSCGDGFGPDQLVARNSRLADETEARAEGMAVLLEKRRAAIGGGLLQRSQETQDCRSAVLELVQKLGGRLDELAEAVSALRRQVAPLQSVLNPSSLTMEVPVPIPPTSDAWQLLRGGFVLISPTGVSIPLSEAERRFLCELFAGPSSYLSYEQACLVTAKEPARSPRTRSSLVVLLARLREKCLSRGVQLPLRSIRGRGYCFIAAAVRASF